ncbi:anti-sigma factor family protein [Lysinibacillus xylanilyticus]|uniref:anti-sigma factor family protein n=1 Tax=Lysinibacillus xylanilyticus TaxID=582475 RepID=UPI003D042D84
MNCNIIKDLLPSYVDGICSEDTVKAIEEHIQHCEECKQTLKRMQQQTDDVQAIPEEVKKAITPFKKINKKRRIQVIGAIVMTFIITIIGAWVIQDVGAVNQIFFPMRVAVVVVDSTDDMEEWKRVIFNEKEFRRNDKDYLIYDSVFWNKEITNHANNESDILLRIKDENGNVIVDELLVSPGTSVQLDNLKNNEKYYFEIKTTQGRFHITAT